MADPTGKHSKRSKAYWSKISAEERSRRMSEAAKARWKGVSDKKKSDYGKMMRAAHVKKK